MNNTNVKTVQTEKQEGQLGYMANYYDIVMWFLTFGREKTLRRKTVQLADLKPGDKVLEIGCGTGTLTIAAKGQVGENGQAVGLDIAPEMIKVASRKAARKGVDIDFREGSIEKIPFPDNSFDTVMCSFMIFHMPDDVRERGFKEIYRVLKPGGQIFILDLALPDKQRRRKLAENHSGMMMQHDVRELEPILKEHGFTDIEMGKAGMLNTWYIRGKAGKV